MGMKNEVMMTGVLLAAGRGRRAGGGKQLLPVVTGAGVVPLVCAAYDAVASACESMVVVLGHESLAVRAALGRREYESVEVDADAAMGESVRAGLRAALKRDATRGVLLQLGDHAWVEPGTLVRLMGEMASAGARAVMPVFRGRGGHPALIPARVAEEIIGDELVGGLREFWLNRPELCVRVEVGEAGVVRDVDRV